MGGMNPSQQYGQGPYPAFPAYPTTQNTRASPPPMTAPPQAAPGTAQSFSSSQVPGGGYTPGSVMPAGAPAVPGRIGPTTGLPTLPNIASIMGNPMFGSTGFNPFSMMGGGGGGWWNQLLGKLPPEVQQQITAALQSKLTNIGSGSGTPGGTGYGGGGSGYGGGLLGA